MLKEIKYDKKEGIVPDSGDLDKLIVDKVISKNLNKK
jgi:hypothetical protein